MAEVSIVNTLIDIAEDSRLRKGEKVSLGLIAKEVKKLLRENKKLKRLLKEVKEHPIAAVKIPLEYRKGDSV